MLFVTVGTHEQPFNRLIQCMDNLVNAGKISETVIMQTGYSTYTPKFCKCREFMPYSEMVKTIAEARIVITHGGPSSFLMPLQIGKIPVVVPRQPEYGEHVNSHQMQFAKIFSERIGNIIPVFDIDSLGDVIANYDFMIQSMPKQYKSNNEAFNKRLETIVYQLFGPHQ